MVPSLAISTEHLRELHDWFATESVLLFEAKTRCHDEESRVRLHVAAQDARRLAFDLMEFAAAHEALQADGLIEE